MPLPTPKIGSNQIGRFGRYVSCCGGRGCHFLEKISVGGIPNSKEVCVYKMDINYHLFFALAVWIFNATWSKHCGKVRKYTCKVQKYTFKVQKYTFKVQNYTFNLQKHTFKVHKQKYTFKVQKQTFKVQKYTFKVQKYTFEVHQYTFNVQRYSFKVQEYTFKVQKRSFKEQNSFRNLGNGISGTRNLLNTSGSRNRVPGTRFPEPVPSKPREQNLQ